ncbi:hypothetical protein GOBAR_DD06200 [Gossypium barbadense]|nr:hypothetical protein GOBAR_DD06200 [Gossypium barbadense]
MELKNDLETYLMVMKSLSEGRIFNTAMAVSADLIKKGLHRETIYYKCKKGTKLLEPLLTKLIKKRIHLVNYNDKEDKLEEDKPKPKPKPDLFYTLPTLL